MDKWSASYNSGRVMLLFGDDFAYDDIEVWGKALGQLELIMEEIRTVHHIEVKFATPHEFFTDLVSDGGSFPHYEGDFLPY
jgi:hypothetical protein